MERPQFERFWMDINITVHVHSHDNATDSPLLQIITLLTKQGKDFEKIMAGITDITSSQTTLHADLIAENGLVKQLLTAFANQTISPAQAQTIIDGMNADDADAKGNIDLITAALPPASATP